MQDGRFPVAMVACVPVVAAPEEIDITNALEEALAQASANGPEAERAERAERASASRWRT
jgi:hypothetical protein